MPSLEGLRAALAPFLEGPLRHAGRILREPEYRRHLALELRLAGRPRRQPGRARLGALEVEFVDAASFLSAHQEIFVEELYRFPFQGDAPHVVDLGANIGLATLWLKRAYPRARILALEPDPEIFARLERNVRANGLADVELVNAAAWNADTELAFQPDGADGGRAAARGPRKVRALAIDRLLRDRPVDFLKIDIEGAEEVVVPACAPVLQRVRAVFVEYHARRNSPSTLGRILRTLEEAGLRLQVQNLGARPRPFSHGGAPGDFDQQLNVFAWR